MAISAILAALGIGGSSSAAAGAGAGAAAAGSTAATTAAGTAAGSAALDAALAGGAGAAGAGTVLAPGAAAAGGIGAGTVLAPGVAGAAQLASPNILSALMGSGGLDKLANFALDPGGTIGQALGPKVGLSPEVGKEAGSFIGQEAHPKAALPAIQSSPGKGVNLQQIGAPEQQQEQKAPQQGQGPGFIQGADGILKWSW